MSRTHIGTGREHRHHHGKNTGEKAAGIAMARGQARTCVGNGEPNLKHAGKRESEEKEQQRHDGDKAGRLELEAPTELASPSFES